LLEEKGICTCRDCMLDVAAIALNNLQPNYRVFLMRPVHRDTEIVHNHLEKVEEAVRQAIALVKKKPHHER
jgi:competence protein ComFB